MLHDLDTEDILQAEFIVFQRKVYNGIYKNKWGYEIFLPHICGQPTVYTDPTEYDSANKAANAASTHLQFLLKVTNDKAAPQPAIKIIFKN